MANIHTSFVEFILRSVLLQRFQRTVIKYFN